MKKILLGINFENESDAAIEDAYLLASKYGSAIIPIHAIEYLPQRNYQHEIDLLIGQIEKRLNDISERLSMRGIEVYEPVIEKGDPLTVLEAAVNVLDIDLLIIGAGVDDPNHHTLGVTAKSIIRSSKVPVWVSNCATSKVDYDNVLCAVDLSPASLITLESSASLAKVLGAKLHILHVEPKMTYYPGLLNSEIPVSPWILSSSMMTMKPEEEYDQEHKEHVLTHEFKDFIKKANLEGVEYDIHVQSGNASKEIIAFTALFNAGLLVLGTTGKGTFLTKLLGGTVEKVLDRLPCTMLCVVHKKE